MTSPDRPPLPALRGGPAMPSRRARLPLRIVLPGLCLAGSVLGGGCATPDPDRVLRYHGVYHAPALDASTGGRPVEVLPVEVTPTAHAEPAPGNGKPAVLPPPAPEAAHVEERPVPVSVDAVLRLAEEGNAQVAQAREKVNESL